MSVYNIYETVAQCIHMYVYIHVCVYKMSVTLCIKNIHPLPSSL